MESGNSLALVKTKDYRHILLTALVVGSTFLDLLRKRGQVSETRCHLAPPSQVHHALSLENPALDVSYRNLTYSPPTMYHNLSPKPWQQAPIPVRTNRTRRTARQENIITTLPSRSPNPQLPAFLSPDSHQLAYPNYFLQKIRCLKTPQPENVARQRSSSVSK